MYQTVVTVGKSKGKMKANEDKISGSKKENEKMVLRVDQRRSQRGGSRLKMLSLMLLLLNMVHVMQLSKNTIFWYFG